MTLEEDLMGCVVTEVGLDGEDGDVISLALSDQTGRQFIIEPTTSGYNIFDMEMVFG